MTKPDAGEEVKPQPWDWLLGPLRKGYSSDAEWKSAYDCWLTCGKPMHGPCIDTECPRRKVLHA